MTEAIPASLGLDEIRQLVGRDDPVILDIGANNGNTSASFDRTFSRVRLFAFEPDPRAVAKWERKMEGRNAQLTVAAVGDFNGRATFHMSDSRDKTRVGGHDKSGSLLTPTGHLKRYSGVVFEQTVEVEVIRLDDWAASHGIDQVDFIWADVQGAEAKLIAGGIETLKRTRYFYTEFSDAELYAGQPDLEGIKALLPFMSVKQVYRQDVLFERIEE